MATCKQNLTLVELLATSVRCMVCLRQPQPPLFQYSGRFRYLCDVCSERIKNEPGCQLPEEKRRDRLMEKLCFGTILKCSFSGRGCQFTGETVFVVATHESSCGYLPDILLCGSKISVEDQIGSVGADDKKMMAVKEVGSFTIEGKSLEEALLAEMDCPVCLTFISPPIRQCENGHNICNVCFERLELCPVCRGSKSSSLNVIMENIYPLLKVPCKNANNGCSVRETVVSITSHGVSCEFSLESCPLAINGTCKWFGFRSEMLDHCKSYHLEDLSFGNQTSWPCEYWGTSTYRLFYFEGIFFRYGWVPLSTFFCFSVVFISHRTDLRYSFQLDMTYTNHGIIGKRAMRDACYQIENDNVTHGFPICWYPGSISFSDDCCVHNVLKIFNENSKIYNG